MTIPGIILVDKPEGMSSAHVLRILKKRLKGVRKIGHAGTLDPLATGVLVCLINGATRLAKYAREGSKIYEGTIKLGTVTDTDDIQGKIIEKNKVVIPTLDTIQQVAQKFTGEISQIPPKYSALHVNGKRAYQLARSSEEFELSSRIVKVSSFDILRNSSIDSDEISFRVSCSKGTYIRSLARDLGKEIGCGGCIAALRRTFTAPFEVVEAKPLDEIGEDDVIGWERLFEDSPKLFFDSKQVELLLNGNTSRLNQMGQEVPAGSDKALYVEEGSKCPLGILEFQGGVGWKVVINIGSRG